MGLIPNPWVILGFVLALLGVAAYSYDRGDTNGAERVQVILEAGQKQAMEARIQKMQANQKIERELQANAERERKETNATNELLNRQLADATRRLQQRPARPAANGSGELPKPAGAGPGTAWATGAELYRDDGQFLVGEAHLAQLVRNQRDTCYRLYRAAQTKIKAATQ